MVEIDSSKYKWFVILGIGFLLLLLVLYNVFRHGQAGFVQVIKGVITSFFFILVIAAVGLFVWFMVFFEKLVDITQEVFEGIKDECYVNCLENLGRLYLVGDDKHHTISIGRIVGYSHRKGYREKEKESIFLVQLKSGGFFRRLFPKSVIIRTPERLHDELQGDVGISCVSLVKHGHYYYPSNLHLSMKYIDETINSDAIRYLNLSLLRHFSPIINKGLGLTAQDIQSTEAKSGSQMLGETVQNARGR